ncbi:MAG TPA: hypothetical protein VIW24_17685 [Aldersonia sp.]
MFPIQEYLDARRCHADQILTDLDRVHAFRACSTTTRTEAAPPHRAAVHAAIPPETRGIRGSFPPTSNRATTRRPDEPLSEPPRQGTEL